MAADATTQLSQLLVALANGGGLPGSGLGVPLVMKVLTGSTANSGTSETDLLSYALPAGVLSADGQALRIRAWCSTAANANNKTVKLYFGSTVISNSGARAVNGGAMVVDGVVIRTAAATQAAVGTHWAQSISVDATAPSTPTETLAGAVTIKVTGQSGTASSDITGVALIVEWVP